MALPNETSSWRRRAIRFATGFPMAVFLVVLYWGMGVSSQVDKSPTFDEVAHLTAGYTYWLANDYRLHPENGVLPQRWAALPLYVGEHRVPSLDQPSWWKSNVWAIGEQFFHREGNDLDAMLLQGRAMIALLGLGLGLVVYGWSRSLFGPIGGMISLLLYTFCPTILAHGSLITSDMAIALMLTVSMWCLWQLLHRVSWYRVLGTGLVLGLLVVSKMSAVLVLPMALLLLVVRLCAKRPLLVEIGSSHQVEGTTTKLAVFAGVGMALVLIAAVVTWGAYGFRYSAFNVYEPGRDSLSRGWDAVVSGTGPIGSAVEFAREHRVLPEAYLFGFGAVIQNAQARVAFLNGEHGLTGWWYFFPYALLVKTPVPALILLACAMIGAALHFRSESERRACAEWVPIIEGLYQTAPLWVLLLVYWAFALTSNLNIGHRHLLPTYPAMFILAGAASYWCAMRYQIAHVALGAILVWHLLESVSIRPHYLAYFNRLDGGPSQAYRHLVDSSLDWGQDLPGLKRWLDQQGLSGQAVTPVYLSYFGTGNPDYYGIDAILLPGFSPRLLNERAPLAGGVYCVSASMLQSVYLHARGAWVPAYEQAYREVLADVERYNRTSSNSEARLRLVSEKGEGFWKNRFKRYSQLRTARLMAYLRQREPDDQVGYSILIYRLSDQDIQHALDGPLAELSGRALR
ncbi:MAG: glycosyltransferase family 39 protein [Nitrospirales bacterium]|nr:glycosyltransferase family 39 protein [Nitrospirales bacterium]